jgi:hypothetical protein
MDKVKEMKAKEAELSSCTSKIIILYLTNKKPEHSVPAFVLVKICITVIHCSLFII